MQRNKWHGLEAEGIINSKVRPSTQHVDKVAEMNIIFHMVPRSRVNTTCRIVSPSDNLAATDTLVCSS